MRQANILSYLPTVIAEIREVQALGNVENPELSGLWQRIENARNDQFLYLMTENGASRWEQILGISPLSTDSLEDRRFRIINKLNAALPYTYEKIISHMNALCGEDGYVMNYDSTTWTLTVRVKLNRKNQYDEILSFLKESMPMNIVIDYDLLYNKYSTIARYTHRELANYSHHTLRNEILN